MGQHVNVSTVVHLYLLLVLFVCLLDQCLCLFELNPSELDHDFGCLNLLTDVLDHLGIDLVGVGLELLFLYALSAQVVEVLFMVCKHELPIVVLASLIKTDLWLTIIALLLFFLSLVWFHVLGLLVHNVDDLPALCDVGLFLREFSRSLLTA